MFLVDLIEAEAKGRDLVAIHVHAYACLCSRDCVALLSCINITENDI